MDHARLRRAALAGCLALADTAGVSKPYVSQIEGGKRAGTAATLKKLAKVLQVPLDALQP